MEVIKLIDQALADSSLLFRIAFILLIAVLTHVIVIIIRKITHAAVSTSYLRHQKTRSVVSLCLSAIVFALYFFAFGLILRELGVSLTAYLASASVIGLAVGFGSQGIVQDVVMGLTIISTDLLDIDDLVEIGGQTGRVKGITMRFVVIQNSLGATVYIPNRSIASVLNYRKGYIRCIVDVTLIGNDETKSAIAATAEKHMVGFYDQFRGIFVDRPSVVGKLTTQSDKEYLRLKFRIWPNRGQAIESIFPKELLSSLRVIAVEYQDWMISVSYEVEEKKAERRS